MIPEEKKNEVLQKLSDLRKDRYIQILHAVESGSRMWGFESSNSDYDVRFIYKHQGSDRYIDFDVESKIDVIDLPVQNDIDIVGWDIRKVFKLFVKSNGNLIEWLHSPIRYKEPSPLIEKLIALSKSVFNPTALCYHYYSIATKHKLKYLDSVDEVHYKKYFYTFRALMCIDYILRRNEIPPILFEDLLGDWVSRSSIDSNIIREVNTSILKLLEIKKKGVEGMSGSPIEAIHECVTIMIENYKGGFPASSRSKINPKDLEKLKGIYRQLVFSNHNI